MARNPYFLKDFWRFFERGRQDSNPQPPDRQRESLAKRISSLFPKNTAFFLLGKSLRQITQSP
jgi:hypothetical protein